MNDKRDPAGVKKLLLQVVNQSSGMSLLQVNIARYFIREHAEPLNVRYVPTNAPARLMAFTDRAEARLAEIASQLEKPVDECLIPAGDAVLRGFQDEIERLDAIA